MARTVARVNLDLGHRQRFTSHNKFSLSLSVKLYSGCCAHIVSPDFRPRSHDGVIDERRSSIPLSSLFLVKR